MSRDDDPGWPWFTAALLLLAAAVSAGVSLALHWRPCRGSMLEGTWLRGWGGDYDFTDACLQRMDTGLPFQGPAELSQQTPWASELGALAIALSAMAWAVVVLRLRWSPAATLIGLLPSLASGSIAVQSYLVARVPERTTEESVSGWMWLLPEVLTVLAVVVGLGRRSGQRGDLTRVVLLAWGTTVFGAIHQGSDYAGMVMWSDANWDFPPGSGVGTLLVLLVTASGVTGLTLRRRRQTDSRRSTTFCEPAPSPEPAPSAGPGTGGRPRRG